jgi:polyphosphate kinase
LALWFDSVKQARAMDQPDLRPTEHYINRELSLLAFNERVLAQALDQKIPLPEHLKFLCIPSNNLDEFFEIRVAGLKRDLSAYLADNTQEWSLGRDGIYRHCARGTQAIEDAQSALLVRYAAGGAAVTVP